MWSRSETAWDVFFLCVFEFLCMPVGVCSICAEGARSSGLIFKIQYVTFLQYVFFLLLKT